MVDAVLAGEGLGRVAELAAEAAGAPVAIVIPRLGAAARRRAAMPTSARCAATSATACSGRPAPVPPGVGGEVPIASGDETIGARAAARRAPTAAEALEFLHLAAVACLTEVAVEEAREEVEQNLRGSFLEELRSRRRHRPGARSCAAPAGSAATSRAARSCCAPS